MTNWERATTEESGESELELRTYIGSGKYLPALVLKFISVSNRGYVMTNWERATTTKVKELELELITHIGSGKSLTTLVLKFNSVSIKC